MFYEANGKKFPVLLQESGIVTVLQGSTWSEWVDHGHYTLTDTKGYSETAAALYKQDTERRAENSQCSPLICNCGKTFSTLVGYRKHLSKCRNILRRERA
jgi:hypothetical protein